MQVDTSEIDKIRILDELIIAGSKGYGMNPKIVFIEPEKNEHLTIMVTQENIIDIHKKNEKTGEYKSLVCKPLKDLEEEIKQFLLNSIKFINPSNLAYRNLSVIIYDEKKMSEIREKYRIEKKEMKIVKEDFEEMDLEKFSKIIPMSEVTECDFKNGYIYDKNGKFIGGLIFVNGKYVLIKEELTKEINKIFGL